MAHERGQMFVPSLMKVIICIPIVRDDHGRGSESLPLEPGIL